MSLSYFGENYFGENLKRMRKERNLTVLELSDLTGIARQSIYNWENGKNIPNSLGTRKLLASVFKVSPYAFDDSSALKENPVIQELVKRIEALENNNK